MSGGSTRWSSTLMMVSSSARMGSAWPRRSLGVTSGTRRRIRGLGRRVGRRRAEQTVRRRGRRRWGRPLAAADTMATRTIPRRTRSRSVMRRVRHPVRDRRADEPRNVPHQNHSPGPPSSSIVLSVGAEASIDLLADDTSPLLVRVDAVVEQGTVDAIEDAGQIVQPRTRWSPASRRIVPGPTRAHRRRARPRSARDVRSTAARSTPPERRTGSRAPR